MTGGDSLRVHKKYKDSFEYVPQWTVFLQTNHLPTIEGQDDAIWRRLYLIPFERQFPMTPGLQAALLQEKEGILRWLVEGAVAFASASCKVEKPQKVVDLEKDYRADSDTVNCFLDDRCTTGNAVDRETRSELYRTYEEYCKEARRAPVGKKTFNSTLRSQGYSEQKDGNGDYTWREIGLKPTTAVEPVLLERSEAA
jgi:putative DNA primase/helicase